MKLSTTTGLGSSGRLNSEPLITGQASLLLEMDLSLVVAVYVNLSIAEDFWGSLFETAFVSYTSMTVSKEAPLGSLSPYSFIFTLLVSRFCGGWSISSIISVIRRRIRKTVFVLIRLLLRLSGDA